MATRKKLLTIERITDCDTGMYRVGEIDHGICVQEIKDYLKQYGLEGRKELVVTLRYLIHYIHEEYDKQSLQAGDTGANCVSNPNNPVSRDTKIT